MLKKFPSEIVVEQDPVPQKPWPDNLEKFQPNIVIGQGLGKQEPWSTHLAEGCDLRDIPVWNDPLLNAENPNMEMAPEWSDILRQKFTGETTAILHSASVIAGLDALNSQSAIVKNLVLIAGWINDPAKSPDPHGKTVQRTFKRNGLYHLEPFLNLIKRYRLIWETINNSVRKKIIIVQSENDPYVHPDHAKFLTDHLPGSEILMIENAGHFQFRPGNKKRLEQNAQLPPSIEKKIFEIVNN